MHVYGEGHKFTSFCNYSVLPSLNQVYYYYYYLLSAKLQAWEFLNFAVIIRSHVWTLERQSSNALPVELVT